MRDEGEQLPGIHPFVWEQAQATLAEAGKSMDDLNPITRAEMLSTLSAISARLWSAETGVGRSIVDDSWARWQGTAPTVSQGGWRMPPEDDSYGYRPNGVFLTGVDLPPELQAGRPPWSPKWVKLSKGTTRITGVEIVLDGTVILRKRERPPIHMHRDESVSYTVPWPLKLSST